MTEFIKPKRVIVDAMDYLKGIFANGLVKDLTEHQAICPVCKGTGLRISNAQYGLKDEGDPNTRVLFPYSNQYITACPNCYTGVVNLCPYCGKALRRGWLSCDCDTERRKREGMALAEEREKLEKATKLEPDDPIAKGMGMYYHPTFNSNEGYFCDIDEFIEYWEDNHDPDDEKPVYVWGTKSSSLNINVYDWLSCECEDLHEDARDRIVDEDELSEFVDAWCAKQTGTTTYFQDCKYAIRIPWGEVIKDDKQGTD